MRNDCWKLRVSAPQSPQSGDWGALTGSLQKSFPIPPGSCNLSILWFTEVKYLYIKIILLGIAFSSTLNGYVLQCLGRGRYVQFDRAQLDDRFCTHEYLVCFVRTRLFGSCRQNFYEITRSCYVGKIGNRRHKKDCVTLTQKSFVRVRTPIRLYQTRAYPLSRLR